MKKILENEDYLMIVQDLLDDETVNDLASFKHHKFTNRLEHSLCVSYSSYKWAKRLRLNYVEVARAALLHDLFFNMMVDSKNSREHLVRHPEIALENAKKIVELTDLEQDIIVSHMFLVTMTHIPKYKESLLVSLIDKTTSVKEVCILPFKQKYSARKLKYLNNTI